jgi:outer membrane protein OmpA-like peptidoglycan-associated protein
MYRLHEKFRNLRPAGLWFKRFTITSLALISITAATFAQEVQREHPTWWFGAAAGANLNFYGGTTQQLNASLQAPTAFHKGFGAGLYLAPLIEYHFDEDWGAILHLAYDDRRGAFSDVTAPCGENSTLSATPSYFSIEPSLRFAPFSDGFFIYGGPRLGFNWSPFSGDERSFLFAVENKITVQDKFSGMNEWVYSGQIGIGYDIPLADKNDEYQSVLSPFISFQPYFGQDPRSSESWAVSTVRVGASIKFGSGDIIPQPEPVPAPAVVEADVKFSVRAPKAVPVKRRVRETFPMRNYVFFEDGSADISSRYVLLTKTEAASFREEQLQEVQPKNMTGRSLRQMTVYYNILNVVGDRMKRNPGTTVTLSGASGNGAEHGKARAEAIKTYLVRVFAIDSNRIITEGSVKPKVPSEVPGGTKELDLIRAGDNRVDIESTSPEMMIQVGGPGIRMLKPVQIVAVVEDPLDSYVLFNAVGAKESFASWSIEVKDSKGKVQRFGPSTKDQIQISGNKILGDKPAGDYTVVMLGQTKSGKSVRKEATVRLVRRDEPKREAVRYSILFDFDKSKSIASYDVFLTDMVAPLVPDSSTIVIHGYTDTIGEEEYNENLSRERVQDTRSILERAIEKSGKKGIVFETFGFGEDMQYAPFDNYYPEQRFYNRTVIIDIVPE